MRARIVIVFAVLVAVCFTIDASVGEEDGKNAEKSPPVLSFKMKKNNGEEVSLAKEYKNRVVLFVNVASECGLTPQYEQLEAMHKKYADQGLAIVGVPCNQFGKQEPGTAEEIREFCTKNYGVEFDLLEKVDVNGDDACPLYKFLTSEEQNEEFAGPIQWNFEKFLVNRAGEVVARFDPRTKPDSEEVVEVVERELAKKTK